MSRIIFQSIQFFVLLVSSIDTCKWSPTQCGCARKSPSVNTRIVGGTPAVPHSWPWIVSIRVYKQHYCGGTLISDQHVLSAAHCFTEYGTKLQLYTFAIGHQDKTETYVSVTAKRIELHNRYDYNGRMIHDIAFIELDKIVDFNDDRFGFVCLPLSHINDSAYPTTGTPAWIAGWGALSFHGPSPKELMQVLVPIINNQPCKRSISDPMLQVCAGYDKGGKDSCQGDSGGPLLLDNGRGIYQLIGIVSFGDNGCAHPLGPGVYTRLTSYIDWIQDLMKQTTSPTKLTSSIQLSMLQKSKVDYQKLSYLLILTEIFFFIVNQY